MQRRKVVSPVVDVEKYRKLVAMKAWEAWRRLPMQTRIWIGVEDMIEDGMVQVIRMSQVYNPNYASFTTALYHRLHRYFINEYLEYHSALKRGWVNITETDNIKKTNTRYGHKRTVDHQSLEALMTEGNKTYDEVGSYPALVVSTDTMERDLNTQCFVIPAIEQVYREASPKLQASIIAWFLTKEDTRIHKKGKPFKKAAYEFRELCQHYRVNCQDCLHLVRSPGCLDTLSRNILDRPYDIENPTPAVERIL